MLRVVFFRSEAGAEPVLEWLRSQPTSTQKTFGDDLRTVQIGWPLGMPLCRSLGDGLYEVRTRLPTAKQIGRLIFFQHRDVLVVVTGFIKKTQKTPDDELAKAKQRKREYERNSRQKS
jgi:phage-related protein